MGQGDRQAQAFASALAQAGVASCLPELTIAPEPMLVGSALASLCSEGQASAVADAIIGAVNDGVQVQAASDAFAEALSTRDPDVISCLAQACAEACDQSVAVADSMAKAVVEASSDGFSVSAAESFVAASASRNGAAFVSGVASATAMGNCRAVAFALAEAAALGGREAVADALSQAECLNFEPLLQLRDVECGRVVRACRAADASCCVPNILTFLPGTPCTATVRGYIYDGTCSDDKGQILLRPSAIGSPCYCQI
eukprot:TRINITY_DN4895_c0_g1_i7.p1 TRINITY_DN4895_c0_g1~~TRINITY_DN4895_c0_g1_i7.p1  ORF type:complete len:286 (-),score=55.80 TRINITY_DN4895_c0_g1_i7:214-984(-)